MARYDNTLPNFTCKHCKVLKPRSAFQFYIKEGYQCRAGTCRDCYNDQARKRNARFGSHQPRINRRYPARFDDVLGEMRRCTICLEYKPLEGFMLTKSKGKPYRASFCSPCRVAYKRAYRKGMMLAPPPMTEKECTYCGTVRPLNEFAIANRKISARCVECKGYKNPDRWVKRTPEDQTRLQDSRRQSSLKCAEKRRAQKIATTIEDIDYTAIYERDKGICYICGKKPTHCQLSYDHVIPLSKGGTHTMANHRVACRSCNYRKNAKLPTEIETYMPLLAVL